MAKKKAEVVPGVAAAGVTAHDFRLPIKDEESLRQFVRLAFGVEIPDKQVCAKHSTPWRAFADAYFARSPVAVWKASRGFGGKSYLLSLLGLTEALTLKADVNVLGGSGEQARRVLEHMGRFWNYDDAPRMMLMNDVQREMHITWGNTIQALMASQASVRGPHPQRLRCDEVDEMKLEILDAALGQPMGKPDIPAQTVLSSTHQYAKGTMTEVMIRAGERGWPVHEWCYLETMEPHGWLPASEVERKKLEVVDAMWRTEYEGQEPSPESRAIQPGAVERMFDKTLGEFDGAPNEYIEIEPPDPAGIYGTGADWARAQDWTIIPTYRFDVNPAKCVAWERTGRMDWPVMVAKFESRLNRYRGAAAHDATGIGDVVRGYMKVQARDVVMVGRERAELLSRYIAGCEHGEIIYPFIRFAYSEHKYASVEDVYNGGSSHHLPDSISGGALAWSTWERAGVVKEARPQANPLNQFFDRR
jgi:hypothetical protein